MLTKYYTWPQNTVHINRELLFQMRAITFSVRNLLTGGSYSLVISKLLLNIPLVERRMRNGPNNESGRILQAVAVA
jgi:hypothetical protein